MAKSRILVSFCLAFVLVIAQAAARPSYSAVADSIQDLSDSDDLNVELGSARKLLASCSILGKTFQACYSMNGGWVGYSISGSTLSVGFKGGSSGWAGWSVGNPHRGSSAVMNIQGSVSTRTMNGKSSSLITSPSKVKFGGVKGGTDGGALAATFTMKWPGAAKSIKIAFATGPGNMMQHIGRPRTYLLTKSLQQI